MVFCFISSPPQRRNNSAGDETIFRLWRRTDDIADSYDRPPTMTADRFRPETVQMRILSFVLACALVSAGSTKAGLADGSLPGVGTFHYSALPTTTSAARAAGIQ
jgi:hypothetical protein